MQRMGIDGKTYITFTVKKDGTVADYVAIRSPSKEFEDEAIRVVKLLKNWIPGKLDGKYADFRFTLPVAFKLQ